MGGEAQQTRGGDGLELAGAGAETSAEGAGGLEDAAPIGELEIGGGRQRRAILGGERAAGDEGTSGIGVVGITEDPVRRPTGTLDGELAGTGGAVGIISQKQVDAAVAGRIATQRQGAGAGAEEAHRSGVSEDDGGVVVVASEDVVTPRAPDIDGGIAREGEETVGDGRRRAGLLVDVDLATSGEISGGITSIKEDTAFEDQGSGVGVGVGGVTAADTGSLSDVGEGSDGQGAIAQHGRAGVVMEAGEGLGAAAVLDEGDRAGGLADQSGERAVTVPVAETDDGRGGVGADQGARAGEGADADTRRGDSGVPSRDRGAGGVQVEGRALTEGDIRVGTKGGGRAGEPDRTLVDIGRTGVGIGTRDHEQAGTRLGERARAAGDQGGDGEGVAAVGTSRGDDDFGGGSA